MDVVFADASYWIALCNRRDGRHGDAIKASAALGPKCRIVTSEMVLVEVLNALSGLGSHLRNEGIRTVQDIDQDEAVDLVTQTPALFRRASPSIATVPTRPGAMDERGIAEALTHDRHFEQKGYRALLRE